MIQFLVLPFWHVWYLSGMSVLSCCCYEKSTLEFSWQTWQLSLFVYLNSQNVFGLDEKRCYNTAKTMQFFCCFLWRDLWCFFIQFLDEFPIFVLSANFVICIISMRSKTSERDVIDIYVWGLIWSTNFFFLFFLFLIF